MNQETHLLLSIYFYPYYEVHRVQGHLKHFQQEKFQQNINFKQVLQLKKEFH